MLPQKWRKRKRIFPWAVKQDLKISVKFKRDGRDVSPIGLAVKVSSRTSACRQFLHAAPFVSSRNTASGPRRHPYPLALSWRPWPRADPHCPHKVHPLVSGPGWVQHLSHPGYDWIWSALGRATADLLMLSHSLCLLHHPGSYPSLPLFQLQNSKLSPFLPQSSLSLPVTSSGQGNTFLHVSVQCLENYLHAFMGSLCPCLEMHEKSTEWAWHVLALQNIPWGELGNALGEVCLHTVRLISWEEWSQDWCCLLFLSSCSPGYQKQRKFSFFV